MTTLGMIWSAKFCLFLCLVSSFGRSSIFIWCRKNWSNENILVGWNRTRVERIIVRDFGIWIQWEILIVSVSKELSSCEACEHYCWNFTYYIIFRFILRRCVSLAAIDYHSFLANFLKILFSQKISQWKLSFVEKLANKVFPFFFSQKISLKNFSCLEKLTGKIFFDTLLWKTD